MRSTGTPAPVGLVARWLLGTALVSWRYMWETTPLHRVELERDRADGVPPEVPTAQLDEAVQLPEAGHGPLFHRRFRVRVADPRLDPEQLMAKVMGDFKHFVPSEVVDVRADGASHESLRVGDDLVVEMPGPWNGPVRVVHREATCLRLVTLRGHLEAGQVEFRARHEDDLLVFEIELWVRSSTPLVHLLYSHLRLAKEVQLNMWVRFCLAAAGTAGGRLADGVHIRTHRVGQGPAAAR